MAIPITQEQAAELITLKSVAETQESELAKKLQTFYFSDPQIHKILVSSADYSSSKWGDNPNTKAIKAYYKYITSIGSDSEFIVDAILKGTVDKLNPENQEVVRTLAADKGFQAVLEEFKKNDKLKVSDSIYGAYAAGNKEEANTFAQIIKNLMKKDLLGKGIKISDTSPHEFKNSILYDIEMSIDDFPFNMEVKTGINDDYLRSHFKYGTFSSTALKGGYKNDDTYKTLLPIIGVVAKDLVNAIVKGGVTDKVINDFAIRSALEYIKWRMQEGHFPIFVRNKQINTCSEIINGFLQGKGSVVQDEFRINLNDTKSVISQYSTSPYIDFMDGKIKEIQHEALKEALKNKKSKLHFKSTVWYGKQS